MSKVRIIWKQGGVIFVGSRALTQLKVLAEAYILIPGPFATKWQQAVAIEAALRKAGRFGATWALYIYREPRKTTKKNSKYIQTLHTLGQYREVPFPLRQQPRRDAHGPKRKMSRTVTRLEQDLLQRDVY